MAALLISEWARLACRAPSCMKVTSSSYDGTSYSQVEQFFDDDKIELVGKIVMQKTLAERLIIAQLYRERRSVSRVAKEMNVEPSNILKIRAGIEKTIFMNCF